MTIWKLSPSVLRLNLIALLGMKNFEISAAWMEQSFSSFLTWEFHLFKYFLGLFSNILPFGFIEGRNHPPSLHSTWWILKALYSPISLNDKGHSEFKDVFTTWTKNSRVHQRVRIKLKYKLPLFSCSFSSGGISGSYFIQRAAHFEIEHLKKAIKNFSRKFKSINN
jgi:hypothetical protein